MSAADAPGRGRPVAGSGLAERRDAVVDALDQIKDPCSVAIGKPVGLVGMGIVEQIDVSGTGVSIVLLPTFPDCLFRGVFEEEIEKRLGALAWCDSVTVAFSPADRSWDESRLSPDARRTLGRPAGEAPRSRAS